MKMLLPFLRFVRLDFPFGEELGLLAWTLRACVAVRMREKGHMGRKSHHPRLQSIVRTACIALGGISLAAIVLGLTPEFLSNDAMISILLMVWMAVNLPSTDYVPRLLRLPVLRDILVLIMEAHRVRVLCAWVDKGLSSNEAYMQPTGRILAAITAGILAACGEAFVPLHKGIRALKDVDWHIQSAAYGATLYAFWRGPAQPTKHAAIAVLFMIVAWEQMAIESLTFNPLRFLNKTFNWILQVEWTTTSTEKKEEELPISALHERNIACPSSEILPGRYLRDKSTYGMKNGTHHKYHHHQQQKQPQQRWCLLNRQNERLVLTVLRLTERVLVFFLLSACIIAELDTPDGRLAWSYRASVLQHWFAHMMDFLMQLLTMKWQGGAQTCLFAAALMGSMNVKCKAKLLGGLKKLGWLQGLMISTLITFGGTSLASLLIGLPPPILLDDFVVSGSLLAWILVNSFEFVQKIMAWPVLHHSMVILAEVLRANALCTYVHISMYNSPSAFLAVAAGTIAASGGVIFIPFDRIFKGVSITHRISWPLQSAVMGAVFYRMAVGSFCMLPAIGRTCISATFVCVALLQTYFGPGLNPASLLCSIIRCLVALPHRIMSVTSLSSYYESLSSYFGFSHHIRSTTSPKKNTCFPAVEHLLLFVFTITVGLVLRQPVQPCMPSFDPLELVGSTVATADPQYWFSGGATPHNGSTLIRMENGGVTDNGGEGAVVRNNGGRGLSARLMALEMRLEEIVIKARCLNDGETVIPSVGVASEMLHPVRRAVLNLNGIEGGEDNNIDSGNDQEVLIVAEQLYIAEGAINVASEVVDKALTGFQQHNHLMCQQGNLTTRPDLHFDDTKSSAAVDGCVISNRKVVTVVNDDWRMVLSQSVLNFTAELDNACARGKVAGVVIATDSRGSVSGGGGEVMRAMEEAYEVLKDIRDTLDAPPNASKLAKKTADMMERIDYMLESARSLTRIAVSEIDSSISTEVERSLAADTLQRLIHDLDATLTSSGTLNLSSVFVSDVREVRSETLLGPVRRSLLDRESWARGRLFALDYFHRGERVLDEAQKAFHRISDAFRLMKHLEERVDIIVRQAEDLRVEMLQTAARELHHTTKSKLERIREAMRKTESQEAFWHVLSASTSDIQFAIEGVDTLRHRIMLEMEEKNAVTAPPPSSMEEEQEEVPTAAVATTATVDLLITSVSSATEATTIPFSSASTKIIPPIGKEKRIARRLQRAVDELTKCCSGMGNENDLTSFREQDGTIMRPDHRYWTNKAVFEAQEAVNFATILCNDQRVRGEHSCSSYVELEMAVNQAIVRMVAACRVVHNMKERMIDATSRQKRGISLVSAMEIEMNMLVDIDNNGRCRTLPEVQEAADNLVVCKGLVNSPVEHWITPSSLTAVGNGDSVPDSVTIEPFVSPLTKVNKCKTLITVAKEVCLKAKKTSGVSRKLDEEDTRLSGGSLGNVDISVVEAVRLAIDKEKSAYNLRQRVLGQLAKVEASLVASVTTLKASGISMNGNVGRKEEIHCNGTASIPIPLSAVSSIRKEVNKDQRRASRRLNKAKRLSQEQEVGNRTRRAAVSSLHTLLVASFGVGTYYATWVLFTIILG